MQPVALFTRWRCWRCPACRRADLRCCWATPVRWLLGQPGPHAGLAHLPGRRRSRALTCAQPGCPTAPPACLTAHLPAPAALAITSIPPHRAPAGASHSHRLLPARLTAFPRTHARAAVFLRTAHQPEREIAALVAATDGSTAFLLPPRGFWALPDVAPLVCVECVCAWFHSGSCGVAGWAGAENWGACGKACGHVAPFEARLRAPA